MSGLYKTVVTCGVRLLESRVSFKVTAGIRVRRIEDVLEQN